MFPGCELFCRTVFLLRFSLHGPMWPLWPPSVWDVPRICGRIEMGGWKRMAAEANKSCETEESVYKFPFTYCAQWKCSGTKQTWVRKHGLLKWRPSNTHTHTAAHTCSRLWLGLAVLHVACSGLLRNAELNHKWTRHTARWHKTQFAGSCSLALSFSVSLLLLGLWRFVLSVSCCHSSFHTLSLALTVPCLCIALYSALLSGWIWFVNDFLISTLWASVLLSHSIVFCIVWQPYFCQSAAVAADVATTTTVNVLWMAEWMKNGFCTVTALWVPWKSLCKSKPLLLINIVITSRDPAETWPNCLHHSLADSPPQHSSATCREIWCSEEEEMRNSWIDSTNLFPTWLVMGNVRSLLSKMDKLEALIWHQREKWECIIALCSPSCFWWL